LNCFSRITTSKHFLILSERGLDKALLWSLLELALVYNCLLRQGKAYFWLPYVMRLVKSHLVAIAKTAYLSNITPGFFVTLFALLQQV